MDARNKITQDMLQPKVERSFSDEEASSDYLFELSDNDSDISDMRSATFSHILLSYPVAGILFYFDLSFLEKVT